jgi:hypothetical protein
MSKQLLFYERAAVLTKQRHLNWSVETGTDYAFAQHVNAVPILAAEFVSVAAEYAIVFSKTDEAATPVVLVGLRTDENLYVTENGGWQAKYIPAFVRRYPFVFSSDGEGTTFTLCIDEEYAGCNQEGNGQPLFDEDGEATSYLKSVIEFSRRFQAQYQPTAAMCKRLVELDLLVPMQAQFTMAHDGERKMSLKGFWAVDRDRLKALSGEQLAELANNDWLELIYAHLISMKNFTAMSERLATKEQAA